MSDFVRDAARRGIRKTLADGGLGKNEGDKPGAGPGGVCVCTGCGHEESHTINTPCNLRKCSKCGAVMTRK